MLNPEDICRLVQVTSKKLTNPAEQAGYGLASGQSYGDGTTKLDPRDHGGKVLVYWKTIPVVANTPFLGRPPTPANVFVVEVSVSFEVVEPRLLLHRLPDGEDGLARDRFMEDVCKDLKNVLARLACKYNPTDLVGGPAQAAGTAEGAAELNRLYDGTGFRGGRVVFKDVSPYAQRHQLDLLIR